MTREALKALAAANGQDNPDERLDLVLRQSENLNRTLSRLETLPLPREAEPAHILPLAPPTPALDERR